MATIIIKLEHSNLLQHSREGVKIQKIVSSISPLTFIKPKIRNYHPIHD